MMLHGIRCVVQRKKGQKEINNTAEAATPAVVVFFFILLNSSSLSLSNIAIRSTKNKSSHKKGLVQFQRIPDCFFDKLSKYLNDTSTIYTGTDPQNNAIDWLMRDGSGYSSCDDEFFIERVSCMTFECLFWLSIESYCPLCEQFFHTIFF